MQLSMYKCVKGPWEVAEITKTRNQLHLHNVISNTEEVERVIVEVQQIVMVMNTDTRHAAIAA